MKFEKFIINIPNKELTNNNSNYKYFEICEKCRKKFLGKYDNNGNCITWKKISINNRYCKFLT